MNATSSDLGPAHVLNIISHDQEINIPSKSLSDPGSTDQRHTITQELEVNIPSIPARKLLLEMVSNDHLNYTMSSEHEVSIPITPGHEKISTTDENRVDGASTYAQSPPSPRNLACVDLMMGTSKEEYMDICVPLHEAAITADWEAAKVILDKRPELVRFAITSDGDTMLHIAVSAHAATNMAENFVEKLINLMEIKDMELQNDAGDYAFMIVAGKGSVKMLELMLKKHKDLLRIDKVKTWYSLLITTQHGNHDMAWYFYNVVEEKMSVCFWTDIQRCLFFVSCVDSDMYDIALKVLMGCTRIATSNTICRAALNIMAQRPDALNNRRTNPNFFQRIANSRTILVKWKVAGLLLHKLPIPKMDFVQPHVDFSFSDSQHVTLLYVVAFFHSKNGSPQMDNQAMNLLKNILKLYPVASQPDMFDGFEGPLHVGKTIKWYMTLSDILCTATETGNTRFVIELLRILPHLIWSENEDNPSILHIAIMHRHTDIYNLLYEIGAKKNILARRTDTMDNNILHFVGMNSNKKQLQTMSGASLLMQRELLWFKEVEKITPPWMRNLKNKDGRTPYDLFSENNQDLVSKGLKWTKDCMVVATLIITIAFAAAFTVPGGYNQETGIPVLTHETSFLVFIIADAVSLFSSSTALLVFLSIMTSPYSQSDFLYSLPRKLIIGLVTLFISVKAMMVTFAASFFVLYRNTFEWLPIFISISAAIPVIIFAALQYPLLVDMFFSMYDSRYLFKPKRRVLYNIYQKL